MTHPHLGPLSFVVSEGIWLGKTRDGHEVCVQGDFFEDVPDRDCEALAVRELRDVEGLLARITAFLETAREPYLDQWTDRRWEVLSLIFTRPEEDGPAVFVATFLLERDEYTVWEVRVRDGVPVALGRR